ncbi:MAG TPA: GGDEF domain-containing protein [Ilumatobacteraceae bacterium]|nr:GGDEF domain-containing protein [Ilumatobacteraceae bacterium]
MRTVSDTYLAIAGVSATPNRTILFALTTIGLLAAIGAFVGLVAVVRNNRHRRAEMAEMSDELTGVGNRRRLDRDLAIEAATAETPVAVIKIDVDHFERINEEHGRDAGDVVLRHLADVLRAHVRTGDVVYRCEDEEFCVLLAQTTTSEAGQVAERMRFAVSRMVLAVDEPLTVSIGVALGRGEHVADTMIRADEALSKSKGGGRDRVTLAAQPLLGPLAVKHAG